MENYSVWLVPVLRTISEALIAGVAISCFSVFLFLLGYLRKEVLARVFTVILALLAGIFTADAFSLTTDSIAFFSVMQLAQWSGFFLVYAGFFHFSLTILAMTGAKLRRARRLATIGAYLSAAFLVYLLLDGRIFVNPKLFASGGTITGFADFQPWIWVWTGLILIGCITILILAISRTKTKTSRRRMRYLLISSIIVQLSTTLSVFAGFRFKISALWWYWPLSVFAYLGLLSMIFLLAYAVVTFCVTWSHRVVRLRLIEWVLRGPVTASVTLILVTLVRRTAKVLAINSEGWTSLLTVLSILLLQYLITVLTPLMRRNNYSGYGREDYEMLSELENMMIFRAEMETYLESLCSVICDKLQVSGAFVVAGGVSGQPESIITAGLISNEQRKAIHAYASERMAVSSELESDTVSYANGFAYLPIEYPIAGNDDPYFLALIGAAVSNGAHDPSIQEVLLSAAVDCAQVLWQRRYYARTVRTLEGISENELNQRYRTVSLLNPEAGFGRGDPPLPSDVSLWVRDALTHYWGGPRLSESPLLSWRIVESETGESDGNRINALRKVLRDAIEKTRPDGEPSISLEWTLYNILVLKFIEGRKVKEIVRRLAMSEADFYRKQKVAIEEVAKLLSVAENEARDSAVQGAAETDESSDG